MNTLSRRPRLDFLPVLTLCAFIQVTGVYAQRSHVGTLYPSEKQEINNSKHGYEVIQWTQSGINNHLYFNIESFIDANHFIFYSDRSGSTNLFRMNMSDGTSTQMTDEDSLWQSAWHWPQFHTLWFISGSALKALNTSSFETRTLFIFEKGRPESFSITCDGRYCVFAENKNPGFSPNHSTGPYALFRLDLQTKEVIQISPDLGFKIGHVQASPSDPTKMSYCWQHVYVEDAPGIVGNTPNRIWWNNIEGTDGGPLGNQEFALHRTHEFWFPDGEHLGYSARYHFGPNKRKQYIGIIAADGRKNFMMPAPVSSSHNQMFSDGRHWVSDLYDGNNLVLFTIDGEHISKTDVLFDHQSSMQGQQSHPHPHFSPDGKYILFSTDRSGTPQVYTVTVNLDQ